MNKNDIEIKCGCGASLTIAVGASLNEQTESRHHLDTFQTAHARCSQVKSDTDAPVSVANQTLRDIATDLRIRAEAVGGTMKTTRRLLELLATSIEGTIASQ